MSNIIIIIIKSSWLPSWTGRPVAMMFLPFMLIFSSSCCWLLAEATVCPPRNEIHPCKCTNYFNLIECAELTSDGDLSRIFSVIRAELDRQRVRPVYDEFKLVQTGLRQLGMSAGEDLFHGVAFRRVSIFRNERLLRIEPETFRSSFNVTTEVMIEDNPLLGESPSDTVALFEMINRFAALNTVHLTDNGVGYVPYRAFGHRPQPALRELFLTDNRIDRVENEAFIQLESLELINLDGNRISRLAQRSLQMPGGGAGRTIPPPMLRIFMRSNKLSSESFPPGIFAYLTRRTYLNLNMNNITKLAQPVFQSFFKRRSILSVLRNPLKCDCDFRWLLDYPGGIILYNSSQPNDDYLLKDYQCAKADDDGGEQQIITEVDHGDFEQCPPSDPAMMQCVLQSTEPEQELRCFGNNNSAGGMNSSAVASLFFMIAMMEIGLFFIF